MNLQLFSHTCLKTTDIMYAHCVHQVIQIRKVHEHKYHCVVDEWFRIAQRITLKGISERGVNMNLWKCNLKFDGKVHSHICEP